jgi:hypothetical protein
MQQYFGRSGQVSCMFHVMQLSFNLHLYIHAEVLSEMVRVQTDDTILAAADGTFDHKSLHGSCPVIKGEKWSATKW